MYNLAGLEDMLKKGYRSVTEGKFNDALSRFNAILHIIPLLVVETRREVDDVKELLGIAKCAPASQPQLGSSAGCLCRYSVLPLPSHLSLP